MIRVLPLIALAVLTSGCAGASGDMQALVAVADALGGRTKIEAMHTLVLEGDGASVSLGQNKAPDSDMPQYALTGLKRTIDFVEGRARQEQTQTPNYVRNNHLPVKQNFGVDGEVAFNVDPDGKSTRQPDIVAKDRRAEYILHHPIGILRAAFDRSAKLANRRKVADTDLLDIVTSKDESLTLTVDATTHVPLAVSSISYDANLGDVVIETRFFDYQDLDGVKVPTRLVSTIDKYPLADIKIARNTVNAAPPDLAAPDSVKTAVAVPMSSAVTVEKVTDGIWLLGGAYHNSVLVEFSDHVELIEAPQNDIRTLAFIAKARELSAGKPLTKVIVTHHHFDHSGGLRAAVSEGLTLVAHETNKTFFEDLARRKHTVVRDALALNPQPIHIETVGERAVVNDPMRQMEIYHVDGSAHADTIVMVYFPKEKILVQADLYNPTQPDAPFTMNLNQNIEKRKLRVERHVPIHGTIKLQADFRRLVQVLKDRATEPHGWWDATSVSAGDEKRRTYNGFQR
jgi:glyoxylase-like metal-dependent hydrolase (beta-lactamase superfamily II)